MDNKVLVETSARHVHLSQQDLETLFGEGYQLTNKKDLSQPGQFACTERVDVVGAKKTLAGVTILGPVRGKSQVELSLTDARSIGVDAPIRAISPAPAPAVWWAPRARWRWRKASSPPSAISI